jgi:NADPH2:quinone reductase
MAHTDTAGLQQYALLTANLSAKVPSMLTDDEAATIPVNSLAPFIALFHDTGLGFPPPGTRDAEKFEYGEKTLVIIGGGSNCGKFGVQFASMVGIGRLIVIAGLNSEKILKGYGASHVVDRHQSYEDIKKQIIEITGGDNITYVYDAVNDDHTLAVFLLSSTKKGVVAVLLPTKRIDERIGRKKISYDVRKVFGASHAQPEFYAELFWKNMTRWIEVGAIKPLEFNAVESGLNVDAVNKVLDDYRDGKNPGKWHVHPNGQE